MNPPEASSTDSGEKWMWALVLASPVLLVSIGFVGFRIVPPDDLPMRNVVILLLVVFGIGVLGLISRLAMSQANETSHQLARQLEATRRIAPEAFAPGSLQLMELFQPRKRSRRSAIFRVAAVMVAWLVLYWLTSQAVPEWSGALNVFVVLIVSLLVYMVWEIVENLIGNARESKRPIPWRSIVVIVAGAIVIGILGILLTPLLEPWATRPSSLPILLLMGIGVFALVFLPIGWDALIGEYVRRPLRRLDYARALARALRVEKRIGSSTYKSIVLLYMGRPEDAEVAIRQSLSRVRRSLLFADSFLGWLEENRGYALVEQKRYDEAVTAFQNGLVFNPKDSDRLTALAEVYLRQGSEPQRALDLTDRSLKHKHRGIVNRYFMRNSVGELRANHAWALAMAGRYAEAHETLEQAFREYDKSSKLSAASLYWRAGHVMWLRGDERAAREHWTRALGIDPIGNYGRLAREMLREHGWIG